MYYARAAVLTEHLSYEFIFYFPSDRCCSGFRWKLSLFRICQIGVAHKICVFQSGVVTHFIFFLLVVYIYIIYTCVYPINYVRW